MLHLPTGILVGEPEIVRQRGNQQVAAGGKIGRHASSRRPGTWSHHGLQHFCHETVLATYYNASNAELLRTHSEDFAEKVRQQSIDPRIPWLYVFHLEFRFK